MVSVTWTGPGDEAASAGDQLEGAPGDGSSDDAALGTRPGESAGSETGARAGTTGDTTASAPERFARELAEHAPFPVALLVVIGIFLWIQNRIDRKDPKLAAAALDEETLRFE